MSDAPEDGELLDKEEVADALAELSRAVVEMVPFIQTTPRYKLALWKVFTVLQFEVFPDEFGDDMQKWDLIG